MNSANECRGHPVQAEVVDKLRKLFGSQALFFWDETNGDQVGVLWRPSFTRESPFAVMDCRYRSVFQQPRKADTKTHRKKRKATTHKDSDEENDSDDSDADSGDGQMTLLLVDEKGENVTRPNYEEIVQHMLVVSNGLLQRK